MKLAIYDFDGTLFDSPDRNKGEKFYVEHTGFQFPFKGWWGRPESLNPPIVPQNPNSNWFFGKPLESYKKNSTGDVIIVLMTGRPFKLRNRIQEILKTQSLEFDIEIFRGMKGQIGNDTIQIKLFELNKILNQFPISSVEMWEDRTEHMIEFENFLKKKKINFEIYSPSGILAKSGIF